MTGQVKGDSGEVICTLPCVQNRAPRIGPVPQPVQKHDNWFPGTARLVLPLQGAELDHLWNFGMDTHKESPSFARLAPHRIEPVEVKILFAIGCRMDRTRVSTLFISVSFTPRSPFDAAQALSRQKRLAAVFPKSRIDLV